jgi:hypothetical protein
MRCGEQRRAVVLVARVNPSAAGEELPHQHEFARFGRRDHLALVLTGLLCMHQTDAPNQPKEKGGRSRLCNS